MAREGLDSQSSGADVNLKIPTYPWGCGGESGGGRNKKNKTMQAHNLSVNRGQKHFNVKLLKYKHTYESPASPP